MTEIANSAIIMEIDSKGDMKKSEILGNKIRRAELLLLQAQTLINEVLDADENGDGESGGVLMMKTEECMDLLSQLDYEICMPLQMEENPH